MRDNGETVPSGGSTGDVLTKTVGGPAWQAPSGGGSTDPEVVRDTIATALIGGYGVDIVTDDPADTITFHLNGGITDASDYGLLAYNYDPCTIGSGQALGASGTLYVMKLRTPIPLSVTNVHAHVQTAGATLTAGQNFAALYDGSKALLGQSADQSTAWTSTGFKTMALTGGAKSVPAGYFYIALWSNGTTRPAFGRAGSVAAINLGLTAANARWASANTGQTTTAPATLGTFTAQTQSYWAGVS